MKQTPAGPTVSRSVRGLTVRSDDGAVTFRLAATKRGVFVERVQLRRGSPRVSQSAVFADDLSFNRWCDADRVRFDYPVVYVNLKRHGDILFRQQD
jgi:hypothetical protein